MLCQKCNHNNATVHYEQNVNGVVTKMDLCPECAKKMNLGIGSVGSAFSSGFDSLFDNLLGSFGGFFENPVGAVSSLSCNGCGTSLNDLSGTSFLGCPDCYDVFDSIIEENLGRYQRGTRHAGKRPHRLGSAKKEEAKKEEAKPLSEIDKLKAELKEAVEKENYEKAAQLRDKIKELGDK